MTFIVDWELDNLGIVVKDIEKAVKHYKRMGIEMLQPPEMNSYDTPNGRSHFKSCLVQNEAIRFNLIEPGIEKDMFADFLKEYGEGVNHMTYRVNDLAAEKARLAELGVPVLATRKGPDGREFEIVFDTRKVGNIITILYSEPAPFPVFKHVSGRWQFHHLGFVVKDIFKFAEYYQRLGFKIVAPPMRTDNALPQSVMDQWTIYGRIPVSLPESRMGMCSMQNKSGTLGLGANAPFGGNDLYQEFLDNRGEGIQHVHFLVKDLPVELANMVSLGFPCVLTQKTAEGRLQESYYDTRDVGGLLIALWGGLKPPFQAVPQ